MTDRLQASGDAVAVTPHHLATDAAIATLRRGGNGVDAAVVANAVLGVVQPTTCGIGGDLFALIHQPGSRTPLALNASGRAGGGTDAAALRGSGLDSIPLRHPATVTVPGCVDGWFALHARFGSMSMSDLLAPAIGHARDGFRASVELADALRRIQPLLADRPSAAGLYPGGEPPAVGTRLRRPDLAATLEGIAADGRDGFYAGPVARGIAEATGGIITPADLAVTQAEWTAPMSADVFGKTAWTIPPNSQGYLVLAAAMIFERLDPVRDPQQAPFHHAAIEAYRAVAWERDEILSDPDTSAMPVHELVDPDRLAQRAASIHPDRVTPWPAAHAMPGGTAYLTVLDADGMGVSLIQSNFHGIGSGLDAGPTGVFLHNRGAGFNLRPGHPNEWTPGRRPRHTLAPTLWTAGEKLDMLLGTRGGIHQPQLLLHAAVLRYHAGLDGAAVQEFPRWTIRDIAPAKQSQIAVETGFPAVDALQALGHRVRHSDEPRMVGWGPISMIDAAGATPSGYADPRISNSSAQVA